MKDFRDLKVWEKALALVLATYKATELFPKHEIFGLVSQLRRCCSSIPANIAEGCKPDWQFRITSFSANCLWLS